MSDTTRCAPDAASALSIAAVEREVGIAKDRLRVWERRYGFPTPLRDPAGDRIYPAEQVTKLKLIKRLLDGGHAPRHLLSLPLSKLAELLTPKSDVWHADADVHQAVEMLRAGSLRPFESWLRGALVRDGVERFVLGPGRAIVDAVGEAWEAGALAIWNEHYFSARYSALLGSALANLPEGTGTRMLFATPSGERHGLGLLMARGLFVARGANCLSLGEDIPNADIAACAERCEIEVVALSLSIGYAAARSIEMLTELRASLPPHTELWVGGATAGMLTRSRSLPEGLRLMRTLEDGLAAFESRRQIS